MPEYNYNLYYFNNSNNGLNGFGPLTQIIQYSLHLLISMGNNSVINACLVFRRISFVNKI